MRAPRRPETLCALRLREPNHSTSLRTPSVVRRRYRKSPTLAFAASRARLSSERARRFRQTRTSERRAGRFESRLPSSEILLRSRVRSRLKHLDTLSPIRADPHVTGGRLGSASPPSLGSPRGSLRVCRQDVSHLRLQPTRSISTLESFELPSAFGVDSLSRDARHADPSVTSRRRCSARSAAPRPAFGGALCDPREPKLTETTRGRKPDHCWPTLPRMRDLA